MRDELEHQDFVAGKRAARMDEIDRQPPEIRELVHQYGWNIVKSFIDSGVTKPRRIRHLVETVLNEFSPTRGTFSNQGVRCPLLKSDAA